MVIMNMLEAKTNLSKLVDQAVNGTEDVFIARNGEPIVQLVPFRQRDVSLRIGIARGLFPFNKDDFDSADENVLSLFGLTAVDETRRP